VKTDFNRNCKFSVYPTVSVGECARIVPRCVNFLFHGMWLSNNISTLEDIHQMRWKYHELLSN
jgi:hypothetical protein